MRHGNLCGCGDLLQLRTSTEFIRINAANPLKAGAMKKPMTGSVGSPAFLYLQEFGSQVWTVFGGPPYLVGSALHTKKWRDVDVRMLLSDEEWKQWELGEPKNPNAKWATLCMAFSELGRKMTGLPIDFQIQQQSDANARFQNSRSALGCIDLRFEKKAQGGEIKGERV